MAQRSLSVTARRVCIARTTPSQDVCLSVYMSVYLSVYLSVTCRYSVKTVKRILKLFSPSGSQTILHCVSKCSKFNPLMGTGNYSARRIIWSWYTGRWWMGCYIWYSEEGTARGPSPPRPLLAVPNVTAHPSTASVPTSYYSMCTIIPCAHERVNWPQA